MQSFWHKTKCHQYVAIGNNQSCGFFFLSKFLCSEKHVLILKTGLYNLCYEKVWFRTWKKNFRKRHWIIILFAFWCNFTGDNKCFISMLML